MSWQQESLRMRLVPTCTSTFPCLFPEPCLQVQGKEGDGLSCAPRRVDTEQV